jgi:hypothetical protein
VVLPGLLLILAACSPAQVEKTQPPSPAVTDPGKTPDWFDMKLTDVQTGEIFKMNDYAEKVVLLETMAMWFLPGALQRQLTTLFARHSRKINFISGLIPVGIAIYDLSKNWEFL